MEEDKESNIDDELFSEMDNDIKITIYHPGEDPDSDFITKSKSDKPELLSSYQINTISTSKLVYSEQSSETSRAKSSQVGSRTDYEQSFTNSSHNTSKNDYSKYSQSRRESDYQSHRAISILSARSSKKNSKSISNNSSLPKINQNTNDKFNGMTTPRNLNKTQKERLSMYLPKNHFNTTIKNKIISTEVNVNITSNSAYNKINYITNKRRQNIDISSRKVISNECSPSRIKNSVNKSNVEHKQTRYPSNIRLESLVNRPTTSVEENKFIQNNRFEESKYTHNSNQNIGNATPRDQESLSRQSLTSENFNLLKLPNAQIKLPSIEFSKKSNIETILGLANFAVKQKLGYAAKIYNYIDPKEKELQLSKIIKQEKEVLLSFKLTENTQLSAKII